MDSAATEKAGRDTDYRALKKNIYLTGATSFFNDFSAEMIYPVIPLFLRSLLGAAAPAFIGIIEGIAESTAAFSRVLFGWLADRIGKHKSMTIGGYLLAHVSKLMLIVAGSWWFVLLARFTDRMGKGLRNAPRDAIISESVPADRRGWGFGFQRAMDHSGAIAGALAAFLLVKFVLAGAMPDLMERYRTVFMVALAPAAVSVIFLFFVTVPGCLRKHIGAARDGPQRHGRVPPRLRIFLAATAIFALGNSSNMFLLIRTAEFDFGLGISASLLLYAAFTSVASIFSTFFGRLSDRVGYRRVILSGYALYVVVYIGFGIVRSPMLILVSWLLYGLYTAMTEGVEKAYVSAHSEAGNRGYALGLFSTIVGAGVLPANVIAGMLYSKVGPASPFIFGGIMALIALALIFAVGNKAGER